MTVELIQQNGQKFSKHKFPNQFSLVFLALLQIAAILQFYDNSLFVMAVKGYLIQQYSVFIVSMYRHFTGSEVYLFDSKKNSHNTIHIANQKSVY